MACTHDTNRPIFSWRNRRTDIVPDSTLMVLNVPNGAGPGTFRFGSEDCFCVWSITTNRDLVRNTQTTKTGRGNFAELWCEDGGTATCHIAALSNNGFTPLGVESPLAAAPAVWAEWYPGTSEINALNNVNIESGPSVGPWDTVTLGASSTSLLFSAPGLCRFASVNAGVAITIRGFQITQSFGQSNPISLTTASTTQRLAVGAWSAFTIRTGASGGDFSIVWSPYPTGV